MPKIKTNSSAKKRFKLTGSRYKHRAMNRNHILTKKRMKRKRHLRGLRALSEHGKKLVARMLGHS